MYLYIHIALSCSSQAAAAVTNAVVTSASKGSGNPLCRREIGRKKLAVHKRSGSHGWIPRWQYSERLPGLPFLKDLSPSLSFSLSLASLCFTWPLRPFFFTSPFFYERRYCHLVFDYREGTRPRTRKDPRKQATFQVLLEFYWTVVALYEEVSFLISSMNSFYCSVHNDIRAFNKHKYLKLDVSSRKTLQKIYKSISATKYL